MGFAGGFTGGFIGGAANSWMNGGSFGDGLFAGLMGGAIGGLAGGLIGGVTGGIKAHKQAQDFWSGEQWNEVTVGAGDSGESVFSSTNEFLSDWDVEYRMNIPHSNQAGTLDCSWACKRSVDRYFGVT